MSALLSVLLHGDDRMNLAYFWASVLTALLPVAAFVALGVLAVKGYFNRKVPDGGGAPPGGGRPGADR
ncbi:MAG TPA: hypothetical protein VNI61_08625 [Gemmatimonadales bacterium]|nr:hypothetical protein [Gemmatimonadales bacterium]